jgi:two-component system, LytTR family, response regulator
MPISAVIIDDEPKAIQNLKILLEGYCPSVQVLAQSTDPIEGIGLIITHKPQLVFLDIDMPNLNGFELLEKVKFMPLDVIFITAFQHFALQAIKISALDFLLKPVSIEELKAAVQKAEAKADLAAPNPNLAVFFDNLQQTSPYNQKLALPSMGGMSFVNMEDILYFMADGNYCYVILNNEKKQLVSKTLKYFEEILPIQSFCRVHREYIINLNYIKKYLKGRGGQIELMNGTVIDVAARKKDKFLQIFQKGK